MSIKYPQFNSIIEKCKQKIKEKGKEYGNSWVGYHDWNFWLHRLQDEIDEIWQTSDTEQFKKEIVDAINVLAMMYDNAQHWHFIHHKQKTVDRNCLS